MWPVNNPPKGKLHATLKLAGASAPTSVYFKGPLNVLIAMHNTKVAAISVDTVADAYDKMTGEQS